MRAGPVTAEQGHISGDGSVCGENAVQIFCKSAPLLHGDHQENIAPVHFQIIQLTLLYFGKAQKLDHLRIDIGDFRLLFAGVS